MSPLIQKNGSWGFGGFQGDQVVEGPDPQDMVNMVDDTTKILNLRQTSHGDFTDNARVAQCLKYVVRQETNWEDLSFFKKEAIEMILFKISRIVTGNSDTSDHWLDIEGYARLARERLAK